MGKEIVIQLQYLGVASKVANKLGVELEELEKINHNGLRGLYREGLRRIKEAKHDMDGIRHIAEALGIDVEDEDPMATKKVAR